MKKLLLLLFLGFTLVGFSQTTLNVIENPTVYAGPNQAICEDEIVNPMAATASNYNSLYWTSSGDGLFTDVQALFPIYVPGPYDITSGIFVLTLTAIGTNNQAVSDAIVITIELCNTDILLNGIVSAENHQIKNVASIFDNLFGFFAASPKIKIPPLLYRNDAIRNKNLRFSLDTINLFRFNDVN